MRNVGAITLFVIVTLCGTSVAMIKPAVPWEDLHPIDACLFGCNMCFDKEFLLSCANQVCLTDLATGQPLGSFWKKACPGLAEFFKWKWPTKVGAL